MISKNIDFAVHPTEDRFFSVRELLHLMGMPHDYEIDSMKSVNHICQNVPVNTAQDWAEEVVRFCRGEAEMSSYTYLKQDNIKLWNFSTSTGVNHQHSENLGTIIK